MRAWMPIMAEGEGVAGAAVTELVAMDTSIRTLRREKPQQKAGGMCGMSVRRTKMVGAVPRERTWRSGHVGVAVD